MATSAARLCDPYDATIFQADDDILRLVGHHGPISSTAHGTPVQRGIVTAHSILDQRTIRVADLQAETEAYPESSELARRDGHCSLLAVPLIRAGQAIGAITIRRTEVRPFSDKPIALLEPFADQAVIAIENERLFSEVREALARQTATANILRVISQSPTDVQPVFDAIVTTAVRLLAYDDTATPVAIRSLPGLGRSEVRRFAERQVELVNTFADQAVIAIENTRLFEAEQARSSELSEALEQQTATGEILGVISRFPTELQPVLDTLVKSATRFCGADDVTIFRLQGDGRKSRELEIASQHKSQFVANMSHEPRTPFGRDPGLCGADAGGLLREPIREISLTRIRSNGRHLLGLINTVLDIAKIESGQFTLNIAEYAIESVVETVRSATEPLAQNKKLALKTEVANSLPIGLGDEQRLTQVLLNLAGNAIKFTDTGEVRVTAKAVNGHFNISVTDTGPGIPEAHHARIFEEFHQIDSSNTNTKGGTDLGLAIAKQIIEMHGGRIWVESTLGKGSTFQIELPPRAELRKPVPWGGELEKLGKHEASDNALVSYRASGVSSHQGTPLSDGGLTVLGTRCYS